VTDSNDWRVTISLTDQAHVEQAQQSISEQEVERDVRQRLGRNIVVGAGDSQIYLYAGTELAATEAERTARDVLGQRGIEAEFALHRWHPVEEEWQSPDVAMPHTEAERQAEHQRLEDAETADSVAAGTALWQARVELETRLRWRTSCKARATPWCGAGGFSSSAPTTTTTHNSLRSASGRRLRPAPRSMPSPPTSACRISPSDHAARLITLLGGPHRPSDHAARRTTPPVGPRRPSDHAARRTTPPS